MFDDMQDISEQLCLKWYVHHMPWIMPSTYG
jgi:hypothetical protein